MKVFNSILFLLFISFSHQGFSTSIIQYTPVPNYQLTQSDTDLQELTDGLVYRHPAWTHKGSVGWVHSSTIQFDIALDTANSQQCQIGILKIVSAKKEIAKVKLPRRIDVYAENIHLQALSINNADYADDRAHTLAVELKGAPSQIKLILHADGPYVMIDEISWEPKSDCLAEERRIVEQGKMVDPQKDSHQRLLNQLTAKAMPTVTQPQPLTVWFDEPWAALPIARPLNQASENVSRKMVGVLGDKQFAVLGVSGACEPGQHYAIRARSSSAVVDKLSFFQVKEQLVFDGSIVYDPLIPIQDALPCPGSSINTYLWVEMGLKAQAATLAETISIDITASNGEIRTADIHLNANNLSKVESCQLNAVNWAYSFDQPIWKITSRAYDDLNAHGINVFVVPPWFLSMPIFDGKPVVIDATLLWSQIAPALEKNPNTRFLLYMDIEKWLVGHQQQADDVREKQLLIWVKAINDFFEHKGMPSSQWALYPVDEPIGTKLDKLHWMALLIKAANSSTQIYANPIVASRNSVSQWQLKEMQDKVDIFQPSMELVQEQLPFFQNLNRAWWLYENPQSPAKSTLPAFYRALGIKAWSLGASGVGFWSYSDTGKSSAWDDFDGKQPDWAVVYEDPKTIISSRRWEAFAQGLGDYRMLCQLEQNNSGVLFDLRQQINRSLNDTGMISKILDAFLNRNTGN